MEYYTETKHPQVSPEYLERLDLREYKNNTTILYLLCNEAEFKNKIRQPQKKLGLETGLSHS